MQTARSSDGTPIAYETEGAGPPVVLVAGALCSRASTAPLGALLAATRTAVSYDRRGRGDSGDTAPFNVQREIEDLAAVCGAVAPDGAPAAVYAHSSGAGVALGAAAAGVPMSVLVLHEPPFPSQDEDERLEGLQLVEDVRSALSAGDHPGAVRRFLTAAGLPSFLVEQLCGDPDVQALAPTLAYDFAVMHEQDPTALARRVGVRTTLLLGGDSAPFARSAAEDLVAALAHGSLEVLDGQGHVVAPEVLVPVLLPVMGG